MAIRRMVPAPGVDNVSLEVTVPTFSFESAGLAELIVEAWTNTGFQNLLERGPDMKVTAAAAEAGH